MGLSVESNHSMHGTLNPDPNNYVLGSASVVHQMSPSYLIGLFVYIMLKEHSSD
jgi:hypothetical protein